MKGEYRPGAGEPCNREESHGRRLWRGAVWALACLVTLTVAIPTWAQEKQTDLSNQSLEDLMNVEVTSVSKTEQKLSQSAAAVFVITQEDIRNSGATNIPDLLRMVPGLNVAQISANTWAISARGFNSEFANKLLVLIDGRAVYTPLFGGVYWDTQDVPLEDIDRIEVIRGPGGSIWGANAVNGVIDIITKKAGDTQGALVSGGGGTVDQGFGTAQFGGHAGNGASYRVFTKYFNEDHFPDLNGNNGEDGTHLLHGGFRIDDSLTKKDPVTIQGDLYSGSEGASIVHSIIEPPENVTAYRLANLSGGNILGRWDHIFSSRSDTTVQFYFDRYARSGPESNEVRNTFDFDFQHHVAWGNRQDVIWGVGFRYTDDRTVGTIDQAFVPASADGELFNSFVQDQITLEPDRLILSVGAKLENSYFTGFDIQPSARLSWILNGRQTVWAAVSRATRTPSRHDTDLDAVLAALPGPTEVLLVGNPNLKPEHVVAYETGYRVLPKEWLSIDVTAFVNQYTDLESTEPLPPIAQASPPLTIDPKMFGNKMFGSTEGFEAAVNWKVGNRWTISPGYSFLEMHLHTESSSLDTTSVADAQGSNPVHQAQIRSRLQLSHELVWDTNAYFVGRLPAQMVASYTRLDTLMTWRVSERGEFSLVGQNLLRDHHLEFNDSYAVVNSSQVKRSAYVKWTWRF